MHFVQSMSHLLFLGVLANESQNLYCSIPALVLFFYYRETRRTIIN